MSARSRAQARGNANRGRVAPFDGPASRGTAPGAGSQSQYSAGPSNTQSAAGSQTQSQASQQPVTQVAAAVARDPALEGPAPRATDTIKNVDMPASFYNIDNLYKLPTQFVARPGFNDTGRVINLPLNSYRVLNTPQKVIYQFDVVIGNGAEKRIIQSKVWNSKQRRDQIGDDIIYDGNKLAWSKSKLGQRRISVDLNIEEGREPSQDDKNKFKLLLTPAKQLDLNVLVSYLNGQIQYNVGVLEAINFLDHLLREGPSRNRDLIPVKRSFFNRTNRGQRAPLGGAIEVLRGVYQTMRVAQGGKLVINLDVANTCFWQPQSLTALLVTKTKSRDIGQLTTLLNNPGQQRVVTKYISKLSVKVEFRGNKFPNKEWKVLRLADVTAKTHSFLDKKTSKTVTVQQYFKSTYNVSIESPDLPLVEMTKKMKADGAETAKQPIYFPMEFLNILPYQRYGAKLDEAQTANMIKFAVSPPNTRLNAINDGKSWLNWSGDKYLNEYGLTIDKDQLVTQARILPSPGITFGGKKIIQPAFKGRWDLRGQQFYAPNSNELVSWGIGQFPGRGALGQGQMEKFAADFIKQYRGHGGRVAAGAPHIMTLPSDPGEAVLQLNQATGNKFNRKPQILVFLVTDKNSQHYLRIKKSCDCRFGVVSQVMQSQQVGKGNPQYYSNVLMKFNAKLGGCTSRVAPSLQSGFKNFGAPTCFIGADVSHASPGSDQASMAAITLSMDNHAGRYAAGCQTNGKRVEMITDKNMGGILGPLMANWMSSIGGGRAPQQVYYMRDGVSESQFAQVMQEEVPSIRSVLDKCTGGKWNGKLTVIIAAKRHHIRAFPRGQDGDSKGNPVPGTLIERDVTMPNEFDFYLYSHIALQGTSRPVHYTVLYDEAKHAPRVIQNMIYEHCYQYMRSTTSVSLHPAVYYAHLASNRAVAHVNIPASIGPQGGPGFKQAPPAASSDTTRSSEMPPLLPLATVNGSLIKFSMWYI